MMSNHRLWIAAVLIFVCRGMFVPENAAQEPRPSQSRAAIDRLITELGSDSFAVREAAGKELVRIGKPARAALKSATTSKDVEVRRRAKTILRQMDDALARRLVSLGAVVQRSKTDGTIVGVWLKVYQVRTNEDQELFDDLVTKMQIGRDLHPTTISEFDPQQMTKSFDEHEFSVLAELPTLESLSIEGTQFSDVVMEFVAGHSDLQYLAMKNTQLTDQGCKHLAGFSQLQVLTLEHLSITDAGCRHLPSLKTITRLSIHDVPITDATLSKLIESDSLERLYLTETKIEGNGLSAIPRRSKICSLMVSSATTKGNQFFALNGLRNLTALSIENGDIVDEDLCFLEGIGRLSSLRLQSLAVTSIGVQEHVSKQRNLNTLSLRNTKIDDRAIRCFTHLPELKFLDLSGCNVTTAGIKTLSQSNSLLSVQLYGAPLLLEDIKLLREKLHPIRIGWSP